MASSNMDKFQNDLFSIAINPKSNTKISPFQLNDIKIALHISWPKKVVTEEEIAPPKNLPVKRKQTFNTSSKTPHFRPDDDFPPLDGDAVSEAKIARIEIDKEKGYLQAKALLIKAQALEKNKPASQKSLEFYILSNIFKKCKSLFIYILNRSGKTRNKCNTS